MLLSLAACGGGSGGGNSSAPPEGGGGGAGEPKYGGTLKLIATGDTNAGYGLPWEVASGMTAPLAPFAECLLLESSYGEISPWLATEWDVDVANLEVRFKLRDDVNFHDGSKFNAEVVKWNIEMSIEGGMMNPAVIGAEVTGEYDVTVKLGDYTNAILNIFASHQFCMVSKEYYEANGAQAAKDNPCGTGPFKFQEQIAGSKLSYTKFDGYWQEGKPYLDGVEYISMSDVMTQMAAMQSQGEDQISVLNSFAGETVATLMDTADVVVNKIPMGAMGLFPSSLDENSPLNNVLVRQAISLAIDRESLVAARGFGVFEVSQQVIPAPYDGSFAEPDTAKYKLYYDVEEAKALLAEAGYPDGFSTTIYGMSGDRDIVIAVQEQLRAIGIEATVEFPESGASTTLRANGWDGMLFFVVRALASISSTFRLHFDPAYQYFPSMWRPDDEALYTQIRTDPNIAIDLIEEYHDHLLTNMVMIPVYDAYDAYVIQKTVHDAGFGDWGVGTMWMPANTWIDQ